MLPKNMHQQYNDQYDHDITWRQNNYHYRHDNKGISYNDNRRKSSTPSCLQYNNDRYTGRKSWNNGRKFHASEDADSSISKQSFNKEVHYPRRYSTSCLRPCEEERNLDIMKLRRHSESVTLSESQHTHLNNLHSRRTLMDVNSNKQSRGINVSAHIESHLQQQNECFSASVCNEVDEKLTKSQAMRTTSYDNCSVSMDFTGNNSGMFYSSIVYPGNTSGMSISPNSHVPMLTSSPYALRPGTSVSPQWNNVLAHSSPLVPSPPQVGYLSYYPHVPYPYYSYLCDFSIGSNSDSVVEQEPATADGLWYPSQDMWNVPTDASNTNPTESKTSISANFVFPDLTQPPPPIVSNTNEHECYCHEASCLTKFAADGSTTAKCTSLPEKSPTTESDYLTDANVSYASPNLVYGSYPVPLDAAQICVPVHVAEITY